MAGNMMEMRFHMRLRFHQIRGLKLSCRMEEDRSWEEALQILEKQQVDLIITDDEKQNIIKHIGRICFGLFK